MYGFYILVQIEFYGIEFTTGISKHSRLKITVSGQVLLYIRMGVAALGLEFNTCDLEECIFYLFETLLRYQLNISIST